MDKSYEIEVKLPVIDEGRRRGVEKLPADMLDGGKLRLRLSPALVDGIAAGDEFVLDDDILQGYRILKRSGNVVIWFYFRKDSSDLSKEIEVVDSVINDIGGRKDGGMSYMVVYTVSISLGFPIIEQALYGLLRTIPGSTWIYGNVYNPEDDSPLNWWLVVDGDKNTDV